MVHEGLKSIPLLVALAMAAGCEGCGGASATHPVATIANGPEQVVAFEENAPLAVFHSKRFDIDLPLPDGRAWKIDDHSAAKLVAVHRPTRSQVTIQLFAIDELANRQRCERAGLIDHAVDVRTIAAVEDANEVTQGIYDTHVVVGLEPTAEGKPLVGHVIAVGGFLHKCFAFDFRSTVENESDSEKLSDRLAFARARILRGLRFENFAEPDAPRLNP